MQQNKLLQIVVNTRLLLPDKLDGIGWFTCQTLKRITQNHPGVHFVFLFDRDYDEQFIFSDNITPLVVGPQARHPFLYYLWFHRSVKALLNRIKPDLFLSPDGFLSPGAQCRQLPVIHDINFLHNPEDSRFLTAKYYNYFFPRYAKAATRIATVSEFSKKDISTHYHIPENKIDVVYNGINEGFRPLSEQEKQKTREQYSQGKPYFLFVGSQSPRKNLVRLIEAFDQFKKQKLSDMKLVLVGTAYNGREKIDQAIRSTSCGEDIIFTGRLLQPEVEKVMGSAFALTFIPYFEGFGIPIVEAMQCEVPVICSNVSSMPEIAGDAAVFVDPFDASSITKAMLDLYHQKALYQQLIENGRKRKDLYSWDRSADLLWTSITHCL